MKKGDEWPVDVMGFETAMLEFIESSRSHSDAEREAARRGLMGACNVWAKCDRKALDCAMAREYSIGQPVWSEGAPGVVVSVGRTRVTVELRVEGQLEPRMVQKAPAHVRAAATPRDIDAWRGAMESRGHLWASSLIESVRGAVSAADSGE